MQFYDGQEEFWSMVKRLKGKTKGNIKQRDSNIVYMDDLQSFYYVKLLKS